MNTAAACPNHAFAVAISDLRERAAKLAVTIEAAERVQALPSADGLDLRHEMIVLRLLIEAADVANGMFADLSAAVDALDKRPSA